MIQWLHMTGIRLGIAMPLLTLFVLGVAGPLGVLLFGNLPTDPAGISELRHMAGDASLQSSAVRTLGVAKQNLASSESNIRDADFAAEMMQFSRSQILSQTGMSMLTQANQAGQSVLSLFR